MLTNCLVACTHLYSTISRTAAHIFVSPGDAPEIITQYVAHRGTSGADSGTNALWTRAQTGP